MTTADGKFSLNELWDGNKINFQFDRFQLENVWLEHFNRKKEKYEPWIITERARNHRAWNDNYRLEVGKGSAKTSLCRHSWPRNILDNNS